MPDCAAQLDQAIPGIPLDTGHHDRADAGRRGVVQHRVAVVVERLEIQVAMGVDQLHPGILDEP
jgi:hypothetical protein